jgi:F-type H+-transporting ATPase subunit delta
MNPEYAHLARKYAQAFIDVAGNQFGVDDLKNAISLKNFLRKNRTILFFLNLSLGSQVRDQAIDHLFKGFNSKEIFKKLILLLIRQRRVFLLPDIVHHIEDLYQESTNSMSFKVASSDELSESDQKTIVSFLEKKTKKNILVEHTVDKHLIAGIRLKSSTLSWEYSVDDHLKKIKQALVD